MSSKLYIYILNWVKISKDYYFFFFFYIDFNVNLKISGLFDLLKNEPRERTTLVVHCLIAKLFKWHDKLGERHRINIEIFVSHYPFILNISCLKYQNNFLSTKNHIRQKIVQYYKSLSYVILPYVVMFYLAMFSRVLTFF